ncbi:MAG: tetratricopeptide repeat protein [Deltaproteobacteria bacterium]|nr:tetratricopeptide repeat protein [Deltaproteobacteria bacterium]
MQIDIEDKINSLRYQIRELLKNQDWQNAIILGDFLIELTPEDPVVHYHMGIAWLNLNDLDQSEKFLQQAQELGDDSAEILLLLGEVCSYRGDLNGEFFWAKKAIEREPDNINAHFVIAYAYLNIGHLQEAEAAFKDILERDPVNVQAHSALADIFLLTQRLEDAEDQLREAIKIQPDNGSLYADLGHTLTRMKKDDDALAVFLTALDLEPDIPERYYNVGDTYLALGNEEKSVLYLRKASQMAPENSLYHYDLGLAFFTLKRYEDCARESEAALRNDPEMRFGRTNLGMSAMENLGLAYMHLEKYEDAEACFQRNLHLVASTYFNLGLTLFRQKKFEDALIHFKHATDLVPNDPEYWDLVGNAYLELNKLNDAQKALEKSIEIDPTYALSYYDLGVMFSQIKGRENEAIKFFKRAISLGEDSHHPHYALACLYSLKNKRRFALDHLGKAIQRGYKDREHIDHDPDFDSLRDEPEFQKLIKKIVRS